MLPSDDWHPQGRGGAVRRAEMRDAAAIRAAYRELQELHAGNLPQIFRRPRPDDFSEAEFAAAVAANDILMLVVERDGEIVATAQAHLFEQPGTVAFLARRRVYVTHLITRAGARRQGHGRALMQAIQAWARQLKADSIELSVWAGSDEAMAFYRALGYRPVYTQLALTLRDAGGEPQK